jgi:hypothetical protein
VTIKSISDQFLLFSGLLVLWSFVSYGMSADPLPDGGTFDWKMWRRVLVLRIIVAAGISYLIGHSIVVSGWLATFAAAQPWIRFRSRQQWTGELEVLITAVNLGFIVGFQKEGTPAFQNLSPSGFLSHLTAFSVP